MKIDKKHQSQNAIRISERHFFFLLESGPYLFSPALCYANVISSFVTIFISKNVETNLYVVPITFPGMAIPNPILSRARDIGRVCGYKYKNHKLSIK